MSLAADKKVGRFIVGFLFFFPPLRGNHLSTTASLGSVTLGNVGLVFLFFSF